MIASSSWRGGKYFVKRIKQLCIVLAVSFILTVILIMATPLREKAVILWCAFYLGTIFWFFSARLYDKCHVPDDNDEYDENFDVDAYYEEHPPEEK